VGVASGVAGVGVLVWYVVLSCGGGCSGAERVHAAALHRMHVQTRSDHRRISLFTSLSHPTAESRRAAAERMQQNVAGSVAVTVVMTCRTRHTLALF